MTMRRASEKDGGGTFGSFEQLGGWMRTLIDYVRSGEPDLTNRQMALTMIVYVLPGPHTVRGLAETLNVSKPVITRALNKLSALGYLRRERDAADRRNIFVARTQKGAEFLDGFERFIAGAGDEQPRRTIEPAHAP